MEVENRALVVVVEGLHRLAAHPAAPLAHTLEEHREVESLDLEAVVETEGIAREVIAHYETVIIVNLAVTVLVNVLDVARLWHNAYEVRTVCSLLVALEESVAAESVV